MMLKRLVALAALIIVSPALAMAQPRDDDTRAQVTTYLIVFKRSASIDCIGSALKTDTFAKRNGEWALIRHDSALDPTTKDAIESLMSAAPRE